MQAIEITEYGGPEVLRLTERPMPAPGAGQVLIAVAASGVNRPDIMQRIGEYPPPPGVTDIPGLEVAGHVISVGKGVIWPAMGDRVAALVAGGGYATHCVADVGLCLPIPDNLTMAEAAAIPENWFTVWDHLIESCRFAAGETVLVHGGGSGIGVAAIQLALALGGRVFTTAGSAQKVQKLEAMGCARAVNYREQDFVAELLKETDGKGVDIILDMVGGRYVARNLSLAANLGRISLIAALDGIVADGIRIDELMIKRVSISGNTLRPKPLAYKTHIADGLRATVMPLLARGAVSSVIDSVFPLRDAASAHRLMESSQHFGKIILTSD